MCERDVHVEPFSELHRPGPVAKLDETMYGTEDASNAWQKLWGEHLSSNGFEFGARNPALYRSELVNGFCHQDDFVTAAPEDQLEIFGKLLHEKFDTKCIGMIGAAEHLDKEMEVLHGTLRVINCELMEIEADQKHFPQLLKDLGLTRSNIVKTPRMKLSAIEAETIENSPVLDGKQTTMFRIGIMRRPHLAQDRVDISEAIKCLARAMPRPRAGNMTQLKRAARYLKGVPRKALQYPAQDPSEAHLEVHVESDGAGDTATCRSTSGVIARRGRHLIRHSSTVQNVMGLSSAECKYYAFTKGGCSGLGLQSLFADWNLAATFTAHRLFKREGSCIAKRSWQEHSSHTDEDVVATRTCSSKTLASCESRNGIKSCRHVAESTWQIENGRIL